MREFLEFSKGVLTLISAYYAAKTCVYIAESLASQHRKGAVAKEKRKALFARLNIDSAGMELTEHEEMIAAEVVNPEEIQDGFDSVGGLEGIIDDLKESVVFPLCHGHIFDAEDDDDTIGGDGGGGGEARFSDSSMFQAPKGVLLYGPPGVGKTLLAKALAKESGARFINVKISSLVDKYLGESEKLIQATFSLAAKIQPAIIFIDEIDALLRQRQQSEHECISMMKAQLMTLWDGLSNNGKCQILVLGATNRPSDIDAAFLRRMPKRFNLDLPNADQRSSILMKLLRNDKLGSDVDFNELAELTDGFSGSDLRELCRLVLMIPMQEAYRKLSQSSSLKNNTDAVDRKKLRKGLAKRLVCHSDFVLKIEELVKARIGRDNDSIMGSSMDGKNRVFEAWIEEAKQALHNLQT